MTPASSDGRQRISHRRKAIVELRERYEHEGPLGKTLVGHSQPLVGDRQVVIEQ